MTTAQLNLTGNQKDAFKEIFTYIALQQRVEIDGKDAKIVGEPKINKAGLEDLFSLIGYQTSEKQMQEYVNKLFQKKEWIEFYDFLKIFSLKMADYNTQDIRNAFKLLAKDDDHYLPVSVVKDILIKNGINEEEVEFLMAQMAANIDEKGMLNYQNFLASLSL